MSDFITMQCPGCGGKLAFVSSSVIVKCENCGIEHMIRREEGGIILESYARCPVCNRNDKAEKVSAVYRNQNLYVQGITNQISSTMIGEGDTIVPVQKILAVPIHTSEMAKYLYPPLEPKFTIGESKSGDTSHPVAITAIMCLIIGLYFGLCFLGIVPFLLVSFTAEDGISMAIFFGIVFTLFFGVPFIIFDSLSLYLFISFVPEEIRANNERVDIAEKKSEDIQVKVKEQINLWNLEWKNAMERWEKLYYCSRDDCVFFPGSNTHAPVAKMNEYLYQP
jgi:predicted RNA-binding Zn-ribbon protein involved in translation (DUF1610 family)